MENQILNQPEETNLYDEPSDDELQRIENELLDFLDQYCIQSKLGENCPEIYLRRGTLTTVDC